MLHARNLCGFYLRNSLQSLNIASDLLEHAVLIATNDNLDLGSAVVEHAASEKAEQNIDGEIAGHLANRRKHRESVGATYFNATDVDPESLRPKPGRLFISQQRVYEDFARYLWQNQSGQGSSTIPPVPSASSVFSVSSGVSRSYSATSGQLTWPYICLHNQVQCLVQLYNHLDLISEEMVNNSAQFSPELHSVDQANAAKETRVTTQLSPNGAECVGSGYLNLP